MNALDERARQAAAGLKAAVVEADLQPFAKRAAVPVQRPVLASRMLAFAGAFAVAMMLAGLAVVQMSIFADDPATVATDPVPPTVILDDPPATAPPPTTVPEPSIEDEPPVVVPSPAVEEPEPEPASEVDTTPPELTITAPIDGSEVESSVVEFRGTTEPEATVNRGKFEADVDAEGNWVIALVVSSGSTKVTFTATDTAGNTSTASVTVLYSGESEPEPPKTEFSAHATFGSCSETPPYDVYYGTAEPGAKITIGSEYGSGSATADAEGNWEKKVHFPEAPYGETFMVTVRDDAGHSKSFEFVSWAEA